MVKNHLKELFPKCLAIYDYNNFKERSYEAFYLQQTGGIAINQKYLIPNDKCKDIDFNSQTLDISQNDSNEIAMNIVLFLFLEFMEDKKFHNSESKNDSSLKLVRNNKTIHLKYKLNLKKIDEKSEYILISNDRKDDSGYFLELSNNKFNYKLITIKNKGKLVKRADLFITSPELLEKYVILKKIAEEKEMSFNFNDTTSIEEEISEMKSKIDIDKYMEEKREKEGEINSSDEIEEEEENSEESEEEEIEDKRMRKILKKFKFKYDEELLSNVESKMDEKGLSQKDYDDLNYIYIKYMKLY